MYYHSLIIFLDLLNLVLECLSLVLCKMFETARNKQFPSNCIIMTLLPGHESNITIKILKYKHSDIVNIFYLRCLHSVCLFLFNYLKIIKLPQFEKYNEKISSMKKRNLCEI